jgi:hypothetical protein
MKLTVRESESRLDAVEIESDLISQLWVSDLRHELPQWRTTSEIGIELGQENGQGKHSGL